MMAGKYIDILRGALRSDYEWHTPVSAFFSDVFVLMVGSVVWAIPLIRHRFTRRPTFRPGTP
jgi:hypothetical protein